MNTVATIVLLLILAKWAIQLWLARLNQRHVLQHAGRVPATFKIVTLTAWAPHAAQPKPLRPGSAAARLAEALGTVEAPAGDPARPSKPR